MDDAALLLLLSEIRHQSQQTAVDAEILRRQIAGSEPTEADAARVRRLAAVASRYRVELDMVWAEAHRRGLVGGPVSRAIGWLRRRAAERA